MRGPGSMRRAEEFDALVDGRTTTPAPEQYGDLLALVSTLRAVPEVEARPAFVADLRSQLVAAAERQEVRVIDDATARKLTPGQRRGAGERRLAAAVGGFAVVAATGSMAMASQGTLPGDALYPVKRALENAQTNLRSDEAERAEVLLAHAESRLAEVEALAARGEDSAAITATLEDFNEQANQAAALALEGYGVDGDSAGVADLRSFSDRSLDRIDGLTETLPEDSRPALVSAAQNLTRIEQAAAERCPECTTGAATRLDALDVAALVSALDTSVEFEDGFEVPEITKEDLEKGEQTVRENEEKAAQGETDPSDGGTTVDPGDVDDPLGEGGETTTGSEEEKKPGLLTGTVKLLTESLGLGKKDKDGTGGLVGGVVDGLTDTLGLGD